MSTNSPNAAVNFKSVIDQLGSASIYEMQGIYYAQDLSKAREEYMRLPKHKRSAARSQAHVEAAKVKNSSARILSWYIAGGRAGHGSFTATNDQFAETIATAKQCKLSGRTMSRAHAELVAQGWITMSLTPTGNVSESEERYVTKKVNTVTLTPQAILLFSDVSHISRPSPKRHTTPCRGENNTGEIGRSLCYSTRDDIVKKKVRALKTCNPVPENEVDPTCQPSQLEAAAATSEHHALNTGRKRSRKPQQRRLRRRKPLTWAKLRFLFLAELTRNLPVCSSQEEAREILRLAKTQTSENFPSLIPTPADWNKIIWTWKDNKAPARNRFLKYALIPRLAAAVAGLIPPDRRRLDAPHLTQEDRKKIASDIQMRERCGAWQKNISEKILAGDYPKQAKQYAHDHSWQLDNFAKLINAGRIDIAGIDTKIYNLFEDLADQIGAD